MTKNKNRTHGRGKILIVAQLPPPFHGSNVMAHMLLKALKKLDREVIFINKLFSRNLQEVGKFTLRKVFRAIVIFILFIYDLIFCHPHLCIYFISTSKGALFMDTLILWLGHIIRLPYVLYFHGKGFKKLWNQSRLWRFIIQRTFRQALGGVVLGKVLKEDISPYMHPDRIVILPNGIESKPMLKSAQSNIVNVLFFSNLIPSKGALEFLEAAKIVLATERNVRFILGGAKQDEAFYKYLKSYVAQNGLKPFVDMPGAVYNENKESLFASSHVFVFPTYYEYETFGLVNLEAMRAGLPVISSSVGAIPEIVQDCITGFIVNPRDPEEIADRILRLVGDPELRERMGRAGRQRFEKEYTFEAYVAHWERALRFFEGLLKEN